MKINDTIPHLVLKVLRRKFYAKLFTPYKIPNVITESDLDKVNEIIYNLLLSEKPCMIARYGEFEINTIVNYLYVSGRYKNTIFEYIRGKGWEWWWNETTLQNMKNNAGFWPVNYSNMMKYGELVVEDSKQVDVIGSITGLEWYLMDELSNATIVPLFNLEPFFSNIPWTRALKDKKVLVVHPFEETIQSQYINNRVKLFTNPYILPEFKLITLKAIQSVGGNSDFKSWFEALDYMKTEINKIDYDIAILGCGAYGFDLAAHIKRSGKKAIHLGGVSQLLFGIRGRRWEQTDQKWYNNGAYPDLMNEYWCRPRESEKPKAANKIEGACYW